MPKHMSWNTRVIMLICGAVGSFAASAHFVLEALILAPSGYIHDAAYLLIMGSLPVGGWSGSLVGWVMSWVTRSQNGDTTSISEVSSSGCLGTIIGWMLIILFMRWIGVKGD